LDISACEDPSSLSAVAATNFSSSSSDAYEGCGKDEQQQHNTRVLKRLRILKTIREWGFRVLILFRDFYGF